MPTRYLIFASLSLALLVQASGCGKITRRSPVHARVFVDLETLRKAHPAADVLQELDREIAALADAGSLQPPPPLSLPDAARQPKYEGPPPATAAAAETPETLLGQVRRAGEMHLQALAQELHAARARKLALRRAELRADMSRALQTEEARAAEPLWNVEQQIFRKYSREIFNLRAALERADIDAEQRASLQRELAQIENRRDAELSAVRQAAAAQLDAFRAQKARELEEALSRYQAALSTEDNEILDARRAQTERELAAVASRLQASPLQDGDPAVSQQASREAQALARDLREQYRQAQAALQAAQGSLSSEADNLRAARAHLAAAQDEEIKAALEEIGLARNLEFVLDRARAQNLPDFTEKAAAWLQAHWQWPQSPPGD